MSLSKAERLREVRVMVSPGASSLTRGRSPMELRRSLMLFIFMDAALVLLL